MGSTQFSLGMLITHKGVVHLAHVVDLVYLIIASLRRQLLWIKWLVHRACPLRCLCKLANMINLAADQRVVVVDIGAGPYHAAAIHPRHDDAGPVWNVEQRIILRINKANPALALIRLWEGDNAHDIYRLTVCHLSSPRSFFGAVRCCSYSAAFSLAQSGSFSQSATPRISVLSHRHLLPEYSSSK